MVSGWWKPNAAGVWQETETQLPLLTHHQPWGWSPALEKGGYTLGLTPIAFLSQSRRVLCGSLHQNKGPLRPAFLSALFKGGGPLRLRNGGGLAASGCVSVQNHLPPANGLLRLLTAPYPFTSRSSSRMFSCWFSSVTSSEKGITLAAGRISLTGSWQL